jgi:polysaccharide export outer membrane protein
MIVGVDMRILLNSVILTGALALAGCASSPPEMDPDDASSSQRSGTAEIYRIGIDDELSVSVWRNDDLSIAVPVRPDGRISVPLIGDVEAGGRTPEEVASSIEEKLTYYIKEPQVTVVVTELRSHEFLNRVRVTGAVETPLSMSHRPGMTVLDLVLEAGGITEFASPGRAKLYRREGRSTEVLQVELDDILNSGRLGTNYVLRPGDIVTVPERIF